MHLPNLSGLSLRNDAPTDVLIEIGTDPPAPPAPPASRTEMVQCIRDKVRPLVYTDQMINEIFEPDYMLTGKVGYYVHNDIVPYGGQYLPGVLHASYDYEVVDETKFTVKVHVTRQNSICGEPVQTQTFDYEYEDTLYEEIEQMLKFFTFLSAQRTRRGALSDKSRLLLLENLKRFARNARAQERNESLQDYAQYMMLNCFERVERPWLYLLNGFKEGGEDLLFTKDWYNGAIKKMLSDNRDEAKEFDDYVNSIYPKNDKYVLDLYANTLATLMKRAQRTPSYPFPKYKFPKAKDGRGPLVISENVMIPRSFWLLFVLQAIEKTLVYAVEAVLSYPPPEPPQELKDNPTFKSWLKQIKGGPFYELWKKEAEQIEEGSSMEI